MDVNNFPMKSQANYEKKKSPKYSNVIFPTKSQANFPKKKPPKYSNLIFLMKSKTRYLLEFENFKCIFIQAGDYIVERTKPITHFILLVGSFAFTYFCNEIQAKKVTNFSKIENDIREKTRLILVPREFKFHQIKPGIFQVGFHIKAFKYLHSDHVSLLVPPHASNDIDLRVIFSFPSFISSMSYLGLDYDHLTLSLHCSISLIFSDNVDMTFLFKLGTWLDFIILYRLDFITIWGNHLTYFFFPILLSINGLVLSVNGLLVSVNGLILLLNGPILVSSSIFFFDYFIANLWEKQIVILIPKS